MIVINLYGAGLYYVMNPYEPIYEKPLVPKIEKIITENKTKDSISQNKKGAIINKKI